MKKIFISFLAVAAIASCAKTEEIYTGETSEIKIQPATSISTKANVTAAIDGTEYPVAENFDVYAYWKDEEAGEEFTDGATVYLGVDGPAVEFTNKGLYWGGKDQTYYWPKNGSLRFAAYSPSSVDMTHNLATDTYSVDGYVQPHDTDLTWDLLVAPTSASYTSLTAAENVSVVFEHALSWITVQVVAKDAAAAQAFDIKKVTIQNVVTTADLDAVMTEAKTEDKMKWTLSDTKQGYVVYEGSQNVTLEPTVIETKANGTLVIPQPTTSLRVDYSQNALPGTPQLDNQHVVVDLLLDADDTPWKAGKHYVYTLVFGLDEILINPDVVDWDDQVVTEIEVGKTNVYSAEQLAAALTAEDESIDVVLQSDIDLPISSLGQQTGGSGEYKLGGVDTKSITIDLNGKKLNVTTTYWSNLGAKNDNALFTIKDGTMTSSQATGTWNSYDLTFSNCNYAFENVVFEKAIAFANTNKSATLKDVTIKETHDYYAMWICAAGQNITVDGLTVESLGRGIKIDEQYEDTPAKVTLKVNKSNFQTENKAAILVKSAAGADITLSNVDITKVNADTDFAVWVDEDSAAYADKVVVNGGLCKVEGAKTSAADTSAELLGDLKKENQTVYLYPTADGEDMKLEGKISLGNGVSLIGLGEEPVPVFNDWGSDAFAYQAHFTNTYVENINFTNNLVINAGIANGNVTFKDCVFGGDRAHQGVHFDSGNGVVVFDNCTFVGRNMFGSSLTTVVFNNCTFLNKKSSQTGADLWTGVNMWGKYEFNNCVFDTEAHCNVKCDGVVAAFNGCSFVDNRDIASVINNSKSYNAEIKFNGKTYVAEGLFLEGQVYTVHSGNGFKHAATNVLNDGTKNVTIELAKDIDLAGIEWPAVKTAAAFVLDGKGYSIKNLTTSAVEDHGFYSTAMFTSTRKATTIKNLVVENATVTGKGGDNSHGAVLVACNYASLNIEGVTVKNSKVSNCDRSSVLVTYLYFTTATVKDCVVDDCTVNSIGTAGALLGMNNSHNFEATGNTVKGTTISSSEGSNKAGILIGTWQKAGTLTESGNVVENSKAINAGTETNNNIGREV